MFATFTDGIGLSRNSDRHAGIRKKIGGLFELERSTSSQASDERLLMSTISTLNNLIETLKDGQQGYRTASEDISSSNLKSLFSEYSLQRSKFAGELQSLAQSLGESDPEDSGSVAGAMHRGWIDLKAALVTRDEHAVLAECERGEDVAVAAYRKALENTELPANVRDTIQSQSLEVKAAHDHIRGLRDSTAAK